MAWNDNEPGPLQRAPELPRPIPLKVTPLTEGWRCPDCKHVYAPSVTECSRCPQLSMGERARLAMNKPVKFGTGPREGEIR